MKRSQRTTSKQLIKGDLASHMALGNAQVVFFCYALPDHSAGIAQTLKSNFWIWGYTY